ncbi:unnamed protein product [Sphagnum tenellum]
MAVVMRKVFSLFLATPLCLKLSLIPLHSMKVAFHKDIMARYVTIDGDIFEPRGLLTGGSRKDRGELLLRLHSLAETEANLAVHTRKLSEIEIEIATLAPLQKKFTLLKSQLELKTYDLSLFEGQAEQSEHHKVSMPLPNSWLSQLFPSPEFQNENKELVKKDEEHQECLKTVEASKKSLKDHGQDRENQLQALEKAIKSLKKHLTSVSEDFKAQETAHEKLIMEKDAAIQEMQALGIELSTSRQQITKLEEAIGEVEAKTVAKLREKHGWIASEKQLFGKPGTDYDFAGHDAQAAQQELEVFLVEQKNNEKKVNKKANALFGKAEEDLLKKREIVQVGSPNPELTDADAYHVPNDKSKDSEGTMAKLEPPEGGDFMDGLEVGVAFGGVWKQSLSELSGGQRSLLALSHPRTPIVQTSASVHP